ncbi:uncharacterized protein DFL_001216 [Arthrobotrys flagrans]|uniref:Uncharacterized protein n=1 Tax=Arthrobotrys flagrans TaxID=97331 RepID=A0A437AGH8_ARTFL|nr:hypothetical protein DFL_001216 [Arthrobotrys flagrans]
MSSAPGLVGYSQDPSGTPGQSEEAAAKEEFESIKPRAEERSSDARKNTPKSAKDAEYGPNQRSEAFKRGEKIGIDIESENSAEGVTAVPESGYRADSGQSGKPKSVGREVPAKLKC